MQVPAGRVETSDVCAKTVRRRTKTLSLVREIASCGDSTSQLGEEITVLSNLERQSLLHQAQLPISIPVKDSLAMKADLAMPWNKLRVLRP